MVYVTIYSMRNIILSIIICLNFFFLAPIVVFAQETGNTTTTTTIEEQTTTLSDTLDSSQTQGVSFGTILIAVITPLLLIIIAYLLIKTLKL